MMGEALFKRSSEAARLATLRVAFSEHEALEVTTSVERPAPSAEEQEIANLRRENEVLRDRLGKLEAGWTSSLDAARRDAFEDAARQHIRDDTKADGMIARSLTEARELFERVLAEACEPLAASFAAGAMRRLFELRRDDEEWLGLAVARRLRSMASEAVVAIHVAPSQLTEALSNAVQSRSSAPIELKPDPAVTPGAARITLRLGEIEVSPEQGVKHLVEVLEGASAAE